MTREIKFRAWDKQGKRMLVPSIGNGRGDYDRYDEIYADSWQTFQIALGTVTGDENLILMQSTGLLDKNGKEIFEGDVVVREIKDIVIKGKIHWNSEMVSFELMDKQKNLNSSLIGCKMNQYEVIGNIYENPELLNQQEQ